MHKTITRALDLLYPRRCPACHRLLKDAGRRICPECAGTFRLIDGHYCLKCGKPIQEGREYCSACEKRPRAFDQGRSVFLYDETLRRSLVRYKYHGAREYGAYYAAAISHYRADEIRRWKPDVIVPVPLSRRKERMRGFNQAALLADTVGKQFGIPAARGLLVKTRDTKSQKKLDADERRRNLRDAFRAARPLPPVKVLLIDDVYTTGSTMDAAAACLKEAGAEKVFFLTLCTGQV